MAKRTAEKAARKAGKNPVRSTRKSAAKRMAEAVAHAADIDATNNNGLTQLGKSAPLPASPDEAVLERVPNPHPDTPYVARFTAPEFTCLCPVTGQPDFAHLVLDYAPDGWLVESKSFKLFLGSFRNTAAFHEDTTVKIGKTIGDLLEPAWLRIGGYWFPRGGIPIDVFWQYGSAPDGIWIPDQGVSPYRGRG